ncbi:MAG TPA: hypothetical protein VFN23_05265 [Ktedonobacteraceae bacterium]|nr:hypothetical protein [Ktedonobacteraceae bacterium]
MELSLRLDTLGMVEVRHLRVRDRYRDWPAFQVLAASRQANVQAYMSRDVAEQLHQQILAVETAVGLDIGLGDDGEEEDFLGEENESSTSSVESVRSTPERDNTSFSPSLAQALDRLNDLARQRLPDGGISPVENELVADDSVSGEEEDALEQLQDAFIQMMDVVRELAEELATDALKLTGRFRCGRTNIGFTQTHLDDDDDDDSSDAGEEDVMELEVELALVLQLYEEGRTRPDDLPAVELQLDVDDFERLHETLDVALERERRTRRRTKNNPPPTV